VAAARSQGPGDGRRETGARVRSREGKKNIGRDAIIRVGCASIDMDGSEW
jgi:hypothetical protein